MLAPFWELAGEMNETMYPWNTSHLLSEETLDSLVLELSYDLFASSLRKPAIQILWSEDGSGLVVLMKWAIK